MIRVCFVCLGNICRSPTAEAVMRGLVTSAGLEGAIEVDSAGTGDWHVGHPPDARTVAAAKRRGIVVAGRARQFQRGDWGRFDYVLALDDSNYTNLAAMAPSSRERDKLRLLRSFDPASPPGAGVPDPYYTSDGFDEVLDLCQTACEHLLASIRETHRI
jgi:protein-tyrosine phosphatase